MGCCLMQQALETKAKAVGRFLAFLTMLQPEHEEDFPFSYCSGMIQTGHQGLSQRDFPLLCCKCPFQVSWKENRLPRSEGKDLVLQPEQIKLSVAQLLWEALRAHSSGSLSKLTDRLTKLRRKFC